MAQVLYFVDGHPRVSREQARELGLAHVFPDSHFVCSEYNGAGPGGNTGCVLGRSDERLGYYADRQTWLKMPAVPGQPKEQSVHVGIWNDARPTPAELLVDDPLRGLTVKLKDGHDWVVPLAREWTGGTGWSRCLPGVLALDESGDWTSGGIEAKYSRLWDICVEFWSHLFGAQVNDANEIRFNFRGANDAALEVLAFNYRLSRAEVVLLGLFDDQLDTAAAILRALVDFDRYLSWQKKSLAESIPAGSSTSAGGEDSPPSTDPPSSTSGRSKRSRSRQS